MHLNTKDMMGVGVETRSGRRVGKVASFDLDQATGRLVTLQVKPHGLVAGLTSENLIIPWDAIVELSYERVVIADAVVPAGSSVIAQANTAPSPTLMKEG